MKTLIIGGVAAGASAAARLRRLDETAEIVLLERGDFVSFANCGLPYRLGGVVPNREALLVVSPELLRTRFRIDVRVGAEALEIDRSAKSVKIREKSGKEYVERYDRLLLATGSAPLRQNVPGADDPRITPLWTIPDSDEIVRRIASGARRALVVGAGPIGLETAENLRARGLETTIVARSQVVKTIDRETSRPVLDELASLGIRVELGRQIVAFEPSENALTAVLDDGRRLESDFVLVGVGVRPNSELAVVAGLATGKRGHIVVDGRMRTSDESIFAAGDVVEVDDLAVGGKTAIALAGPANKEGRIAANTIFGDESESAYPGTLGASILKIGALSVGSVGWTEKSLVAANKPFRKVYLNPSSNAGFYPGGTPIFVKLIFAPNDGKILGAQFVGRRGVDKRTDVVATAARFGATVFDLATLELSYAPPFNAAKDPINDAGTIASNLLTGKTRLVYPDAIPADAALIDVRTREEYELATIPGAANVPLDELRDRLGELDSTRKIVVFCQVGKRGYVAERILRARGFDVANLSGGFTAWRYFNAPLPEPESASASASNPTDENAAETAPIELESRADGADGADENAGPTIELDVRALSCPGPIVRLRRTFDAAAPGTFVRLAAAPSFEIDLKSWARSTGVRIVRSTKTAERLDALLQKSGDARSANGTVCERSTCNPLTASSDATERRRMETLIESTRENARKTAALVLFSDDLDKATAAMIMACGAAASGLETSVFFTFWGLSAIRKNPAPRVRKDFMSKMFGALTPKGPTKLRLSKMDFGGFGRAAMKRAMKARGVPSLPELIEQAKALGVRFIACETAMKTMGISRDELVGVDEVAGVGRFIELAKDAGPTLFV